MSPQKPIQMYNSINTFLSEHEEFALRDEEIICTLCYKKYPFNPSRGVYNLKKHLAGAKHQERLLSRQEKADTKRFEDSEGLMVNNISLLNFMTQMNYPISDLDTEPFKLFAKNFLNFPISSSGYYRKTVLPELYDTKMTKLKELIQDKSFYIILDSTTDAASRQIMCVMIGACSIKDSYQTYLLSIVELQESKAQNYVTELLKILFKLFGDDIDFDKFALLITDQAPVMLATGRKLKETFQLMKHITCLAHFCHNVAEKVRSKSGKVDKIVSLLKRMLIKNNTNKKLFYQITGMKPAKFPILIRWGLWLEFVGWLYDNFMAVGDFISAMDEINETENFKEFTSKEVEREIRFCRSHLWITKSIAFFEGQNHSTEEQIKQLNTITTGITDDSLQKYIITSLEKNPDISFFKEFNDLRSRKKDKIYANVPLTSVDVERAFSLYRKVFDEQRQSFKTNNLNQYLFLYFNKNL